MESFLIAVNAVIPFVIYVVFGYCTKRLGVLDETAFVKMNKLIFTCFYPVLMFSNFLEITIKEVFNKRFLIISVTSVLLLIAVLFVIVPRVVKDNSRRGTIIQAVYRSNFVMFALPLAMSVCGEEGRVVATMIVTIIVPIYNISAVIILEFFRQHRVQPKQLFISILKNPFIIGSLLGVAFHLLGIRLPVAIDKPIKEFAAMTSPLALFVLGGSMRLRNFAHNTCYLIPVLITKLLLLPLIATLIVVKLHVTGAESFVYLILFASPVASGSYPMAANMGGDGELAGQLVVLSTVLSLVTLFFWIMLYSNLGLLG